MRSRRQGESEIEAPEWAGACSEFSTSPEQEMRVPVAMRILVVDDEPQVLEVFRRLVEQLDCEVVALTDSREAARRINVEKFDGIALDAVMPHLDGLELTRRIRASRSNCEVPIILFTGQDTVEMMRRGFQAGITFFLAKPLSSEKLRGLIGAAQGAMLQERRRYVRLPFRTVVDCRCAGKNCKARSVDVAKGGIMLESDGGMEAGQIVGLEFVLPGTREPLNLLGKVTREEGPNRVAIEFIDPEPKDRKALERFITAGTKE